MMFDAAEPTEASLRFNQGKKIHLEAVKGRFRMLAPASYFDKTE